jgi:hypothetical protein
VFWDEVKMQALARRYGFDVGTLPEVKVKEVEAVQGGIWDGVQPEDYGEVLDEGL